MASPEGLARRHRFEGRQAFSPVFAAGKRLHAGDLTLILAPAETAVSRLGVAVGRRAHAKATVRNALKRVAREAFRRHPVRFAGLDVVILARAVDDEPDRKRWSRALGELFGRAAQAGRQ